MMTNCFCTGPDSSSEELEAKLAKSEALLADATYALKRIASNEFAGMPPQDVTAHFARVTLAKQARMSKTESIREYPREVMILIQELINLKFSLDEHEELIGSKLLEQWDQERPTARLKEKNDG